MPTVLRIAVIILATIVAAPPTGIDASKAQIRTCSVENEQTQTVYERVQKAVREAIDGDVLLIAGTCVGSVEIRNKQLRLIGDHLPGEPNPTLQAAGETSVLTVEGGDAVIVDLTLTGGSIGTGGGVAVWPSRSSRARVRLKGETVVTGNEAYQGGGVFVGQGSSVTLSGNASVTGNKANWAGGGVYVDGHFRMNDASSIASNDAKEGGGISMPGSKTSIVMNDDSSVAQNRASRRGGGIEVGYGDVFLNDRATVTNNSAATAGGGIGVVGRQTIRGTIFVCSDEVAITPNDPDDPPEVRYDCR